MLVCMFYVKTYAKRSFMDKRVSKQAKNEISCVSDILFFILFCIHHVSLFFIRSSLLCHFACEHEF